MNDDNEYDSFLNDLAASLRATAASAPRSPDPFGGVRTAIGRARRRRTAGGAAVAVLAVSGAAIGLAGQFGPARPVSIGAGQTPTGRQHSTSPAPSTPSIPSSQSGSTSVPLPPAWPNEYPNNSRTLGTAMPVVNAMITASGKKVSADNRAALTSIVEAFAACGYPLNDYQFKLLWAGNLQHSGHPGAVLVDVTRDGTTYRTGAFGSYKGVYVDLPVRVQGNEIGRVEGVDDWEFDLAAQTSYEAVIAAPGSQVVVTTTAGRLPAATVGASGVVEIAVPHLTYQVPGITVTRPDGSTGAVPAPHDDAAGRLDAWKLLPADTACKSGL